MVTSVSEATGPVQLPVPLPKGQQHHLTEPQQWIFIQGPVWHFPGHLLPPILPVWWGPLPVLWVQALLGERQEEGRSNDN